jgi:hypothetical protein
VRDAIDKISASRRDVLARELQPDAGMMNLVDTNELESVEGGHLDPLLLCLLFQILFPDLPGCGS